MGEQYQGNPNAYPEDFTLPDDSSPPTAAEVNVGLEALGDRTAWLKARLDQALLAPPQTFTDALTEFIAPANLYRVHLRGCGGGGGGGGGGKGSGTTNELAQSGSGGGGAPELTFEVDVTPGTVYEIVIGEGGAGGAAGTSGGGGNGADGGATIFREQATGTVLATFPGGKGGRGGAAGWPAASDQLIAPGGGPFAVARPPVDELGFADVNFTFCSSPQVGGDGVTAAPNQWARAGAGSPQGYAGGDGGVFATGHTDDYYNGAGGGGGGAGPYGAGGDGGAGALALTNDNGGNGAHAAANTGAGGGGGGSGGAHIGASPWGAGGAGGNGGSGRLVLTPTFRRLVVEDS